MTEGIAETQGSSKDSKISTKTGKVERPPLRLPPLLLVDPNLLAVRRFFFSSSLRFLLLLLLLWCFILLGCLSVCMRP